MDTRPPGHPEYALPPSWTRGGASQAPAWRHRFWRATSPAWTGSSGTAWANLNPLLYRAARTGPGAFWQPRGYADGTHDDPAYAAWSPLLGLGVPDIGRLFADIRASLRHDRRPSSVHRPERV